MSLYTTVDKVANAARNIEIQFGRTATVTPDKCNDFLDWADDILNSRLSALYVVPLQHITRNGKTFYPFPIEHIATHICAGLLVESIFSRIEPVLSDAGKLHREQALSELDEICNGTLVGSRRLEGQKLKARNSFVNPAVAPLEPPKERRG